MGIRGKLPTKRETLPSEVYNKELTLFETIAYENIADRLGISEKEAKELLKNDERFNEIMQVKDKEIRLRMIDELLPKILDAADNKIEYGSMAQAKEAVVAAGIVKDKAMGQDKYSQGAKFEIAGKQVQINVGFPFKPYSKRKLDS